MLRLLFDMSLCLLPQRKCYFRKLITEPDVRMYEFIGEYHNFSRVTPLWGIPFAIKKKL